MEQAISIMREGQGSHFDPVLLTQFFCLLPELERISRDNPDEACGRNDLAKEQAAGSLILVSG